MTRLLPAAAFALPLAITLWAPAPAPAQTSAISAKEKMETCKFGAAEQELKGKAEQDFIRKCMANEPAAKKSPAKPASTTSKTQPAK